MGALPFAHFQSKGWAGHDGVDLIADVTFFPTQPLQPAAPVEFELDFRSFIRHGHPLDHVRLVVCWTAADTIPGLGPGDRPWLLKYRYGSHEVPVAIVSRFPGVSVG
jgi:hypothetical protein